MEREYEDEVWDRAIDNAIILMSLTVAHYLLNRGRGKGWEGKIKNSVMMRVERLIEHYKDPTV